MKREPPEEWPGVIVAGLPGNSIRSNGGKTVRLRAARFASKATTRRAHEGARPCWSPFKTTSRSALQEQPRQRGACGQGDVWWLFQPPDDPIRSHDQQRRLPGVGLKGQLQQQ